MTYENETPEDVQELGLSTAKMGVIYVGGEIATSVIVLVLLIFLARYLQPAAFGIYTIAIAFNGVLGIASNFGIGTAFRKMIPEIKISDKRKINELLNNGYFIATTLGLIIAVVGILVSNYVAVNVYHNSAITVILEIAALAELFTVLFNLTQGALLGLGLVKEATIANTVYSVVYLIGSVALVLLGYGVVGALLGFLAGLILASITGFLYTVKNTGFMMFKPSKTVMKKLTNFSAPVAASYVATQGAQNFSVLLLGVFAAASVVGNYGAAFKTARFVEIIITTITFVLVGTFSAALVKKTTAEKIGEIYNSSLYYTALFLFPLIAYSVATAQPITNILYSSAYSTTPLYFSIIVVGMTLGLIGSFAGTLIISKGDTKRFMKYQVGAVIIQLILLLIFTPTFQALGVLFSLYIITPMLLNFIYMRALEEQFKFKQKFDKLARLTLVSVIIAVLLFLIAAAMQQSEWTLLINAVVLIALFPPLAAVTKGITKSNLEFLKSAGKRLKQLNVVVECLVKYAYIFVKD
jgi:O-antigen/teichoic acid export membrane protein